MSSQNSNKMTNIEKLNFFTIPNIDKQLLKISIVNNGKIACDEYKNLDTPIKKLKFDNCNVGLLTGVKNNITVVDLDFKDDLDFDDHIFVQKFGSKFVKKFDTFTVKSPRNGYHLYFTYDGDLKQTQNDEVGIDIRNDGGYIVIPPSIIRRKKYEIINNKPLKQIDEDLKNWLLETIYKRKEKKENTKKDKNGESVPIETEYEVVIKKDEMINIINKLNVDCKKKSDDFRGDYTKWSNVLRACKITGMKKEFVEWSKKTIHKNFNESQLNALWDKAHADIYNFLFLLKSAKVQNKYTFKRVPNDSFNNYIEINETKLNKIFKPKINYLVKSDTGTGKTTAFRKYIKKSDDAFISITSRIALSFEQYNDLIKDDISVYHYQDKNFDDGDNIIITPESCMMLSNYDFSNYIIFMDEFDSIVNHILTSDTLSTKRYFVFFIIIKMLMTCKQFICVDADISNNSKLLLDSLDLKYTFYVNIFKHYQNVNVRVINNEENFYDELKSKDKFLLCSDSKTSAEICHAKIKEYDDNVVIFTSDSEQQYIHLDDKNKVIFSPKIIYGLDSTMERDVFCYFVGNTISPTQMVQQIARCRNIKNVYIYFHNRSSKIPNFDNVTETASQCNELIQNYIIQSYKLSDKFEHMDESIISNLNMKSENVNNLFNNLYINNAYKEDCYNSNKFLHLLNILNKRGFEIKIDEDIQTNESHKDEKKELYDEKLENFDTESTKVNRLNEYMKIPDDKIEEYKEIFIDKHLLAKHINISKFFFRDNDENIIKLCQRNDFDISKCKDVAIKIDLLNDMLTSINLDKNQPHEFKPSTGEIPNYKTIQSRYEKLFRIRSKDLNLSTKLAMYQEICKIYKNMFNITTTTQIKLNQTRFYSFAINVKELNYHKQLYDYRQPHVINKKIVNN